MKTLLYITTRRSDNDELADALGVPREHVVFFSGADRPEQYVGRSDVAIVWSTDTILLKRPHSTISRVMLSAGTTQFHSFEKDKIKEWLR